MSGGARFDPRTLDVKVGLASERGPRADNQDFAAVYLGTPASRASYGVVAALADGVSGAKGGRVAAELSVRGVLDGYLGQKETPRARRGAGPLRPRSCRDGARADYIEERCAALDRFLLTSDGVHGPLSQRRIATILAHREGPDATAEWLVAEALAPAGGTMRPRS